MEEVFQRCIREVRDEGRTVLLSSHILAEVEALCDRVSIIRNGRTVEAGTLDSMRQLTRTSIHAETDRPPEALDRLQGVHGLTIDHDQVRFDVDTVHLAEAVQRLSDAGLRTLVSTPPTLEELFLRHYGDEPLGERRAGRGAVNHLAGALLLVRDIVRRDRLRLVLWIAGIVALVVVTVGSTKGLYPTQAQLDEAAGRGA